MSDELIIRNVRAQDMPALEQIARAAWRPVYESFRRILGDEIFEAYWPDALDGKARQVHKGCAPDGPGLVYVAELAGRVVGFVSCFIKGTSPVAEIGNNAVHPDFQRHGIAGRMYRHVFDRLRERGVQFVEVHTGGDPSHAPARRAYEKAGFDRALPGVTYYRKL